MSSFVELGVSAEAAARLEALGISSPVPIQTRVIPQAAAGKSVLFEAETGSGKTFAYALPLLDLYAAGAGAPRAPALWVVCPTVELASQQKRALESVMPEGARVPLLAGGAPLKRQAESLARRPAAVTGTPARLCELVLLRKLRAEGMRALVLDEVDRLFARDLSEWTERLLKMAPRGVQAMGLSATVNARTEAAFAAFAPGALVVREAQSALALRVEHQALFAEERDKIDALRSYLYAVRPERALVFCARLDRVEKTASVLASRGVNCRAAHAHSGKMQRKSAVDAFRAGRAQVLVTSDLAARGLDIPDVTHVIQLDMPERDGFVHRAGRTARMGKRGVNVVIGTPPELRRYAALEKALGLTVYPKALFGGRLVPAS